MQELIVAAIVVCAAAYLALPALRKKLVKASCHDAEAAPASACGGCSGCALKKASD